VLKQYGDVCACCSESNPYFLQIDHINGGGIAERRALGIYGQKFLRYLEKQGFPGGYRVLCANCNFSMGLYGFCPHQNKGKQLELFRPKRNLERAI
jgi:hypothetical protein